MSGVMEWAEELYSYGLNSGPDKNVCSEHFSDLAIKKFIKKTSHKEECDYCGKTKITKPLEDVMKFLMETISYYYTDPVEFASYNSAEGGYLVEHWNAWEILQDDLNLSIEDIDLFKDMEKWIDFGKAWADENSLRGEGHYARLDSWSYFCHLVKHQVRYLFPTYRDNVDIHADKPLEILKEIEKMIYKYKLIKNLSSGTVVVRCRQHDKIEQVSSQGQMCAPEINYCKNPNRMSPAGISMFYCAFELSTALNETIDLNWKETQYTTVSFELKEEIVVVDLSKLPISPSVFDQDKRKQYADLIFLNNLVHDLSKPIDRDGKVHIDYVPTQIVTEFLRFMFKKKVHGIIYPSSRDFGNSAMVLFYNHDESLRHLNFLPETLQTKSLSSYRSIVNVHSQFKTINGI